MFATGLNYGVASFMSWSKSMYGIPKQALLWGLEGPGRLLPPSEGEQLEWVGGDKPESTYLPQRQEPKVNTWLVENIRFTWITSLWLSGS